MTPKVNAVSVLIFVARKEKLVSARIAHLQYDYPTLENQPESLINEALSLTSMDDCSVRLTKVEESNKL